MLSVANSFAFEMLAVLFLPLHLIVVNGMEFKDGDALVNNLELNNDYDAFSG